MVATFEADVVPFSPTLTQLEWNYHNQIFSRSKNVYRFYLEGTEADTVTVYDKKEIDSLHDNLMGPNFCHIVNDYRGKHGVRQVKELLHKAVTEYISARSAMTETAEDEDLMLSRQVKLLCEQIETAAHEREGRCFFEVYDCESELFIFLCQL